MSAPKPGIVAARIECVRAAIFNGATATLPFVTNGQLVGLAVSGPARLKNAPNLPTFAEASLEAGDAGTWQGLMATGGSPPELIARLNGELRKILAEPDIAQWRVRAKLCQGPHPRPFFRCIIDIGAINQN